MCPDGCVSVLPVGSRSGAHPRERPGASGRQAGQRPRVQVRLLARQTVRLRGDPQGEYPGHQTQRVAALRAP